MNSLKRLIQGRWFMYVFHYPSLFLGMIFFILTRKTPWVSYWSMRKIYAHSGPVILDRLSKFCDVFDYKTKKNEWDKKSIFQYSETDVSNVVQKLEKDGYCILPVQLPEEYLSTLMQLASQVKCEVRQSSVPGLHQVNLKNPVGPWYEVREQDMLKNEKVIELAKDSLFLNISQAYLKSTPVNDLVAMWWTLPNSNPDKDLLAQKYHFDLDRLKFLKFFFYLTDVEMDSGPHCFIRGSHKNKAEGLNHDRRYSDKEILETYGKENEIVMTGKRGLILAEDTRGFHKGLSPIRGHRLMFQLEYTSSLFGQVYNRFNIKEVNPVAYEQFSTQPSVWQRFI